MKVNLIGTGNVATHFVRHLHDVVEISTIYSRCFSNAKILANEVESKAISNLKDINIHADLTIVMVSDDAVKNIVDFLPRDMPIVHSSGSIPIDVFSGFKNCGILYPLQSFSKESKLEMSSIPFLIEANNSKFEKAIIEFCQKFLSKTIHITTSDIRSEIHLAAVISNNFITHLLAESEAILKSNNLSLDLLSPLINETINKSFKIGPLNAQTGPAKRNDTKVLSKQMNSISNLKLKTIYKLMSELIQNKSN